MSDLSEFATNPPVSSRAAPPNLASASPATLPLSTYDITLTEPNTNFYKTAFDQFEQEMRPYINLNQRLGAKAANLFRSQEKKNLFTWLIGKLITIVPGKLITFFINRATRRIQHAANAIKLKDYESSDTVFHS